MLSLLRAGAPASGGQVQNQKKLVICHGLAVRQDGEEHGVWGFCRGKPTACKAPGALS